MRRSGRRFRPRVVWTDVALIAWDWVDDGRCQTLPDRRCAASGECPPRRIFEEELEVGRGGDHAAGEVDHRSYTYVLQNAGSTALVSPEGTTAADMTTDLGILLERDDTPPESSAVVRHPRRRWPSYNWAARVSRPRATRERIVPTGTRITSAAST